MAIIGTNGIKGDGGSNIKSQVIKTERRAQEIKRPVDTRAHRPTSSLPNKGGMNKSDNLRKNRDVAKPQGSENKDELNPLQKAEQNRKPIQQQQQQQAANRRNSENRDINGNPSNGTEESQQPEQANGGLPDNNGLDERNNLDNQEEEQGQQQNNRSQQANPTDNANEEEGTEQGDTVGKKIWKFIKKHPMVIVYALLFLFAILAIILVIALMIAIFGGKIASDEEAIKNYGPFFAFGSTEVAIVDPTGQIPLSSKSLTLGEYLKGIVYLDTMNLNLENLSNEQIVEFYKALFVSRKAEVLKKGDYNNKTKMITLKVTDFNYCDVDVGCKYVTKNGRSFYLSNSFTLEVDSTSKSIDPLVDMHRAYMAEAYNITISEIVTPKDVNEPLTEYKWNAPSVTSNIISSFLSNARNNTKYTNMVEGTFSGYKVYNLDDYVEQYESVYMSAFTYWWPIGSDNKTEAGDYSGDPASLSITSKYGPSFSTQTINKGIKISGVYNQTKVIAAYAGTVTYVGHSEKYGNYVIIAHEDNVKTLYGSLAQGSIKVSANQKVEQGTLIGLVGKIKESDTPGLYFEVYVNGINVNPLEYISDYNPRPNAVKYIKFVQGADNKQTVCKTFLASGFSKNATAGLMANIEHESGFRLDALSDGGTSNGLFQWHKGRLDNLKKYCGANYLTSISCQLDFFLYEITVTPNAQGGIYNYLMGNHSAYDMGYQFCIRFERPAGGAVSADKRGKLAESKYVSYVNNGCR